jgi:hypothetical protein
VCRLLPFRAAISSAVLPAASTCDDNGDNHYGRSLFDCDGGGDGKSFLMSMVMLEDLF